MKACIINFFLRAVTTNKHSTCIRSTLSIQSLIHPSISKSEPSSLYGVDWWCTRNISVFYRVLSTSVAVVVTNHCCRAWSISELWLSLPPSRTGRQAVAWFGALVNTHPSVSRVFHAHLKHGNTISTTTTNVPYYPRAFEIIVTLDSDSIVIVVISIINVTYCTFECRLAESIVT